MGEARMDDGVAGDLTEVSGSEFPDLCRHTVLLHQGLFGQMDLQHASTDFHKQRVRKERGMGGGVDLSWSNHLRAPGSCQLLIKFVERKDLRRGLY